MRIKGIILNPAFLLFLFFYFYFLFIFDPTLYYHYHQPIFLFDDIFFKGFLLFPGGLIEWVTCFFLQFLYFGWFGSFLISAIFSIIYVIVYHLIGQLVESKSSFVLAFLPVSLLLILQNNYSFSFLIPVKFLFSLIGFSLYQKTTNRNKILPILLSGSVYFILGGWFFLFYIVLCILDGLFWSKGGNKSIHAGLFIFSYFLFPYCAARYLFVIPLTEAYFYIVPYELYHEPFLFKPTPLFYLFFLSLPGLFAALFVYLTYFPNKLKLRKRQLSRYALFTLFLLGALVLKLSFRQEHKNRIQIDLLAEQGKWQELLTLSPQIGQYNRQANFNINRALYHTGQLLDNLFSHPQLLGTDGLFIHRILSSQTAISAGDLYFELGHINASRVMAYEGLTRFKYTPRILKRLALTHIIDGELAAAGKFLVLLKKSLLHREWAKRYENYLSHISLIEDDRLIQSKRKLKPQADFFIDKQQPDKDLIRLLIEEKSNKMAFEYLMAFNLLECKTGHLIRYLPKFEDFGYRKFPRHIEEALLLLKAMSPPDSPFNLDKYRISPQVISQFSRFNKILFQNRENEERAKSLLKKEFEDTYWYYVRFTNPKITKVVLKLDFGIPNRPFYGVLHPPNVERCGPIGFGQQEGTM